VAEDRKKRKLTAIFSADVAGYSRLMADDDEATVHTINAYRELMTGLITDHRGRVVDAKGDNVLAEFPSVVNAVRCAVQVQKDLMERNSELQEHRRMDFRIGINLGDVIEEEGTIYGDGVNIAARVEGLAEPGGICISGKVHEEVVGKLGFEYEYLGKQDVKNIEKPLPVYKVLSFPGAAAHGRSELPLVAPASVEKMAFPLPDKTSIAVLPFVNMSGDPKQEYIADGITENITAALSKIQEMFVIARTSTMTYKGKSVTVKQVSEELGVRYVLEGSVQKEGDRVRITAQLVDAIKGHHLWAERYDRDMKGFFDLLDEMTKEIATALQVKLTWGDYARFIASTNNFEAWGYFNEGYDHYLRLSREYNDKARWLFERALGLDPEYLPALRLIGWTHVTDALYSWSESPQKSIEQAVEVAQKVRAIDESDPGIQCLWAFIYFAQGQYENAISEGEKAIAKAPNFAIGYFALFIPLYASGRFEEAIPMIKTGMRLHGANFPVNWLRLFGDNYCMAGRYEEAISAFKKLLDRGSEFEGFPIWGHAGLAISYIWLDQEEAARNHAAEVLKIDPKFSIEGYAKSIRFKNQVDTDRVIDALRKAGLK